MKNFIFKIIKHYPSTCEEKDHKEAAKS